MKRILFVVALLVAPNPSFAGPIHFIGHQAAKVAHCPVVKAAAHGVTHTARAIAKGAVKVAKAAY